MRGATTRDFHGTNSHVRGNFYLLTLLVYRLQNYALLIAKFVIYKGNKPEVVGSNPVQIL